MIFGAEIHDLSDRQLAEVFSEVPSQEISRSSLDGEGLPLLDALCAVGLAKSKGEARRAIGEGGVYVNNHRVADIEARLSPANLAGESIIVLRKGKKNYALLRCVG